MHGPEIQWYVILSGILFTTGALGVMIRRNPLIILLSVEIMLNAANLLLIAMARLHGGEGGQIFAISVMAIAASEVVVGLGLIVAMGRRGVELDVDKLRTLRG
jgi:NADH-quinone oxidoreductase subunit K